MNYMQRMAVPDAQDPIQRLESPHFEDVPMGYELHLAKPPITRLQIAKFAGASGDFNPSHVDEDIARDRRDGWCVCTWHDRDGLHLSDVDGLARTTRPSGCSPHEL
jgi:acyl dehydratase